MGTVVSLNFYLLPSSTGLSGFPARSLPLVPVHCGPHLSVHIHWVDGTSLIPVLATGNKAATNVHMSFCVNRSSGLQANLRWAGGQVVWQVCVNIGRNTRRVSERLQRSTLQPATNRGPKGFTSLLSSQPWLLSLSNIAAILISAQHSHKIFQF